MTLWRRRYWLAGMLALSSCTGDRPAAEEQIRDIPAAQQRVVTKADYGLQWPFVAERATLGCRRGAVLVRIAGVDYALNSAAVTGRPLPDSLRVLEYPKWPPSHPLSRVSQEERQKIFDTWMQCGTRTDSALCRRTVRDASALTDAEVDQILVEGRERIWPPLVRQRHALNVLMAAGLELCS